jgi:hypothetical protein
VELARDSISESSDVDRGPGRVKLHSSIVYPSTYQRPFVSLLSNSTFSPINVYLLSIQVYLLSPDPIPTYSHRCRALDSHAIKVQHVGHHLPDNRANAIHLPPPFISDTYFPNTLSMMSIPRRPPPDRRRKWRWWWLREKRCLPISDVACPGHELTVGTCQKCA